MNFYYDSTLLLLIPCMLFSMWAQFAVQSAYRKYSKVASRSGVTGAQAAVMLTQADVGTGGFGASQVAVMRVGGNLSDHYDPRTQTINLSQGVHDSTSLAALGIAAHEAGHAIQDATGYLPIRLHRAMVPVVRVASYAAFPIILLGMLLNSAASAVLLQVGVMAYMVVVAYYVITLPVEFNASRRAVKLLAGQGIVASDEIPAVRSVLRAAAMTYLAAALSAAMQVVRILLISKRRR